MCNRAAVMASGWETRGGIRRLVERLCLSACGRYEVRSFEETAFTRTSGWGYPRPLRVPGEGHVTCSHRQLLVSESCEVDGPEAEGQKTQICFVSEVICLGTCGATFARRALGEPFELVSDSIEQVDSVAAGGVRVPVSV